MTSKEDVLDFVKSAGSPVTTTEIANAIGDSTDNAREWAKELREEGEINGAKNKRIPAVIIKDNYVVLTNDREHLLSIIEDHAPSHLSRARSMSIEDIQQLIRQKIAERVVGGPEIWEFWG